jgi:6-phosphogluconolactonase
MQIFLYSTILALGIVFNQSSMQMQPKKEIIYIGTYEERGSQGIYVFEFDREKEELSLIQTIKDRESPSYLAIHPSKSRLYATNRQGVGQDASGSVSAFIIGATGQLELENTLPSGGISPCHISIDPLGRYAYLSHYASSHMVAFNLNKNGSLGEEVFSKQYSGSSLHPERQNESHLHSIIPDESGNHIYISDLGTDLIHKYRVDDSQGLNLKEIAQVKAIPGSGPRHAALHPNGQILLSVEEISSTISLYVFDQDGQMEAKDRQELLMPDDQLEGTNTAADLQISPDGRFVYVSNRGVDNIVVFEVDTQNHKLKFSGKYPCGGEHPRSIGMDQKGAFLFVLNRHTDQFLVFERNQKDGSLRQTNISAHVPGAVAVVQLFIE